MTQKIMNITINLNDSKGIQKLAFSDVQRIIGEHLNASNFSMAALISTQLADQLQGELWPQLVAAESLFLLQQTEPAFQYIDRALRIDPGNLASLVVKSQICLSSGDQKQAIQLIDSAVRLAPDNAKLHGAKAEILRDAGLIDAARESFLKSIQLDPRNTHSLFCLSQLPGDNINDKLINNINFLIQSRQLSSGNQIEAHFALARAYDKKSDIANHFKHLNAGNNLKNHSLAYDPDASSQEAQDIINIFSEDFFKQHDISNRNSADIIFIVGFPRCGSTLIEQILSSHPAVSAAGEIFSLRHAIRDFQQSGNLSSSYPFCINQQSTDALAIIANSYMQKVQSLNNNSYLTDKLLDNYKYIGLIHLIFPNAIIINAQRNPIDICYSCYKNLFNLSAVPFTYNLENLASKYRDYQQVIQHWNKVLPGKIHTVKYEQLISRQEEVTQGLLKHCGLPWNDACMNFHRNTRTVQTNSNVQVRQRLYADSVDRWKAYEEHLGPLLELTND